MTDESKQKLKYWLIGLFSGGCVAAPVTAFVCKKVYDKKVEEAETRGMNAMAEYAVQQQAKQNPVVKLDVSDEINKIFVKDKPLKEEDYAEKPEPEEEDINNYDVSIDDEEATEDARERTEAHERYLDMIDKYNGNADIMPYIISEEQYENEQYMEKSFVNWYEVDDVFEEDLKPIDDPFLTFGVTSGRELFRNAEDRRDPDICYVRNERNTTDFEISRIHGSYAEMVGGESSLGETNP